MEEVFEDEACPPLPLSSLPRLDSNDAILKNVSEPHAQSCYGLLKRTDAFMEQTDTRPAMCGGTCAASCAAGIENSLDQGLRILIITNLLVISEKHGGFSEKFRISQIMSSRQSRRKTIPKQGSRALIIPQICWGSFSAASKPIFVSKQ